MLSREDAYHFAYRLAKDGATFNAVRYLYRTLHPKANLSALTFRNLLDGYEDANANIERLF